MKFFVDTADVNDIRELAETGLLDGVTTNPSLIAKSGRDFLEVIREVAEIVEGPVSAEVTTLKASDMIEEGLELAKIGKNIAVKVPLTMDGLKACKHLSDKGIMVNVTLCFSVPQAIMAAKAGATFISPFVGRHDDIGQDGMQLIADICQVYNQYPALKTEVLVASVRHPMHVVEAARMGADVATVPPKVLKQFLKHPLTDSGLEAFMKDIEAANIQVLKKAS